MINGVICEINLPWSPFSEQWLLYACLSFSFGEQPAKAACFFARTGQAKRVIKSHSLRGWVELHNSILDQVSAGHSDTTMILNRWSIELGFLTYYRNRCLLSEFMASPLRWRMWSFHESKKSCYWTWEHPHPESRPCAYHHLLIREERCSTATG